jgi:hypothetical protein
MKKQMLRKKGRIRRLMPPILLTNPNRLTPLKLYNLLRIKGFFAISDFLHRTWNGNALRA